MRSKLTMFILLITKITSDNNFTGNIKFNKPPLIAQELSSYFDQMTLKDVVEGSKFCMYFSDNSSKISMYVVNAIIKVIKCPGVTMTDDLEEEENLKHKPSAMIVFLGDQSKLSYVFKVMLDLDQYNVRVPTMFIFCKVIEDDTFLENIMMNLWRRGFIKYIMILLRRNSKGNLTVKIYTYNPFQNLIYSFDRTAKLSDLYPDFLLNLYGHELRIGLFEDWPSLKQKPNVGWHGIDYEILKVSAKILNATYRIIEPRIPNFSSAHEDLVKNRTDICFVKYFKMDNFENVEFSYPLESDSAFVFVPAPQLVKQYHYLFMVFDYSLWLALGSCFITVLVLLKLVVRYHHAIPNWPFFEVFLEVWSIMLSMTVKKLYDSKTPVKCVVIPWMVICLVLSVGFQCNLRNQLQFPKYQRSINSLQDLIDNEVRIYSSLNITSVPLGLSGLKKNVILKSNKELKKMCQATDYSGVFVFPYRSKTPTNTKRWKKTTKYIMLREPLMSGHGVYIFKKNSPYVDKFNKILLKLRENGLYMKMASFISKVSYADEVSTPLKITVFHLQGVFLIHACGIFVGMVVFLMEVGHVNLINHLE